MSYNVMYKQNLKQGLEIGQPFITSRNIIIDYKWLPHWKCTVTSNWTLLGQNGELGQKMANGQLLFQALSGRKQKHILLVQST